MNARRFVTIIVLISMVLAVVPNTAPINASPTLAPAPDVIESERETSKVRSQKPGVRSQLLRPDDLALRPTADITVCPAGTGTCDYDNIQAAVDAANPGDVIKVAIGMYTSIGDEVVLLDKNVTLSGGWDGTFTAQSGASTIDGKGSRRGINVSEGVTAIVERFTVQNGSAYSCGGIINWGNLTLNNSTVSGNTADSGGGGIGNNHGHLTLNNSTVSGNTADSGGGIGNNHGHLTLNNSTVSGNTADWRGGGIYNGGTMTLTSSTVSGNTSRGGGGIANSGRLTLTNSTVSGNTINEEDGGGIANSGRLTLTNSTASGNTINEEGGGGIYNWGTMTLNNSTVSGNTVNKGGGGGGGGILNSGSLTLNNSTVSGNTAPSWGGGIRNIGTLTLNNSTVSGNTSLGGDGGIMNWAGGVVILQNSILADNTANSAPDCSGIIGSSGYNLIGDTMDCTFTPGPGDLTNVSPKLGPLLGSPGYHPLLTGSPAIDAVPVGRCTLATDQRGVARPQGAACDIGAYEYTTPGPAASIYAFGGTPQRIPPLVAFAPLLAVVLDHIGSPVNNAIVTFSAPASGASGMFADSGTVTTTAVTDEGGVATAATFTANELQGSYTVRATVSGVVTPANFLLTNIGWYVAPGGDDANDCQTPATPCATLDGPLGKAGFTAGDGVLVARGTYTGTGDEVVLLDKDVTLSGGWDVSFTTQSGTSTIDGERSRQGLEVAIGVTAMVEWFVIQNAAGWVSGCGIDNYGSLILTNSTVSGNNHGSICNEGSLTLNNSTVSDNNGGGIYNSGTMTLINSTVSGNTSRDGGGIANSGSLTLNNSTVSGNTAPSWGGGIRNIGTLTLNNSTVNDNTGPSWGGILNYDSLTLNNSTVSGNTATGGGTGGIANSGSLTLNNSTVNDNTAPSWGGILNYGNLTLNNSTVSGNTSRGGGIRNIGTLTLNNSTVSDNYAGGISTYHGTVTLINSTVSGNTGGGISTYHGTVTLINSTVSGNRQRGITNDGSMTLNNSTVSGNNGGGILNSDYYTGPVTLQNTILAGNTAHGGDSDCEGSIGSSGYNLIGNASGCTFASTTGDLTDIDAKLGALEGSPGYHPLLPGSPAIDAGNPAGCTDHLGNPLTTDQRGMPRMGQCDIGAYELQQEDVYLIPPNQVGSGEPGTTVAYTLQLANQTGDTDSFNLRLLPGNTWATTLSLAQTGPLPHGANLPFTVWVAIPPASHGSVDSVTIQATSVAWPTLYSDSATISTTAEDRTPPTSAARSPEYAFGPFQVTWSGSDAGSGIAAYEVWVRDGAGGTWSRWLADTSATSAQYTVGVTGHTYYFRSLARDVAGNVETDLPAEGDTHTTMAAYGIEGQVTNTRHEPVFGAMVAAQPTALNVASSDGSGRYTLYLDSSGTYTLTVSREGFGQLPPMYGLPVNANLSGVDFVLPPLNEGLANSGWETGNLNGWHSGPGVTPTVEMTATHTGYYGLRLDASGGTLGFWPYLTQTVSVPVAWSQPTLSFMRRVLQGSAGDALLATISGVGDPITHSVPLTPGDWTHTWRDLSGFKGQTVTLRFGFQSQVGSQQVYLDEISLGQAKAGVFPVYLPVVLKNH